MWKPDVYTPNFYHNTEKNPCHKQMNTVTSCLSLLCSRSSLAISKVSDASGNRFRRFIYLFFDTSVIFSHSIILPANMFSSFQFCSFARRFLITVSNSTTVIVHHPALISLFWSVSEINRTGNKAVHITFISNFFLLAGWRELKAILYIEFTSRVLLVREKREKYKPDICFWRNLFAYDLALVIID